MDQRRHEGRPEFCEMRKLFATRKSAVAVQVDDLAKVRQCRRRPPQENRRQFQAPSEIIFPIRLRLSHGHLDGKLSQRGLPTNFPNDGERSHYGRALTRKRIRVAARSNLEAKICKRVRIIPKRMTRTIEITLSVIDPGNRPTMCNRWPPLVGSASTCPTPEC